LTGFSFNKLFSLTLSIIGLKTNQEGSKFKVFELLRFDFEFQELSSQILPVFVIGLEDFIE